MIVSFYNLFEVFFIDNFDNFVVVSNMIMWNLNVRILIIIIVFVICIINYILMFFCIWINKLDLRIIKDFMMFVVG